MEKGRSRLVLILVAASITVFGIRSVSSSADQQGKRPKTPNIFQFNIMQDVDNSCVVKSGDWIEVFARLATQEFDMEIKQDGESLEQIVAVLPVSNHIEIRADETRIIPKNRLGDVETAPHVLFRAKANGKTIITTVVRRGVGWNESRSVEFVVSEGK